MHIGDRQPSILHRIYKQFTTRELVVFSIVFFFWMPEKIPPPECFLSWAVMLIASSVISVNTIWIETHSWAVLLVSVDSSHSSEKHSESAMSLQRCSVKSSALNSRRCITVLLDSRRDFIDDNICSLFLKSQNKESAASPKASFIIICFRLLLASAVWKTTVVLLTSSLTFLFLSSLFRRQVSVVLFMKSSKVSLNIPLLQNCDGNLTNQTNAYIFFFLYPFFC